MPHDDTHRLRQEHHRLLFLTSSCFTLAKCVRDAQETGSVISRLDQARLERLLAGFDPYAVPHLAKAVAAQGQSQNDQGAPGHGLTLR